MAKRLPRRPRRRRSKRRSSKLRSPILSTCRPRAGTFVFGEAQPFLARPAVAGCCRREAGRLSAERQMASARVRAVEVESRSDLSIDLPGILPHHTTSHLSSKLSMAQRSDGLWRRATTRSAAASSLEYGRTSLGLRTPKISRATRRSSSGPAFGTEGVKHLRCHPETANFWNRNRTIIDSAGSVGAPSPPEAATFRTFGAGGRLATKRRESSNREPRTERATFCFDAVIGPIV